MKKISFSIIDTSGQKHFVEIKSHAHRSLMEFIVDELLEEIGDCKGRAWCGTCIVKQVAGADKGEIDLEESYLLEKYPNLNKDHIRLSCQLEITTELEGTCWEIVDSRLSM